MFSGTKYFRGTQSTLQVCIGEVREMCMTSRSFLSQWGFKPPT